MKTIELFYVYDKINEVAITNVLPMNNMLTAALGFRDSYIKNKKTPYNYQQLKLVNFGSLHVDENGQLFQDLIPVDRPELDGKDVMHFITNELKARGIDDIFEEEEAE